ncbi:MAG: tyrosine-type recombinase/integrase [Planctomycetes bacterium]|nr:tyrosine-type recombinase/integrase [Planctomycetota bacterium]
MIRDVLASEVKWRDLALFETAIDSMLRSVDLLRLRVRDVMTDRYQVKERATIRQQKTGKPVLIALTPRSAAALAKWINETAKHFDDFIFTRLKGDRAAPIKREHYAELVKRWAQHARLDPANFSTHSLRRTKAAIIYAETGNLEIVRQVLGQASLSATSAYLGIDAKEAADLAARVEV